VLALKAKKKIHSLTHDRRRRNEGEANFSVWHLMVHTLHAMQIKEMRATFTYNALILVPTETAIDSAIAPE